MLGDRQHLIDKLPDCVGVEFVFVIKSKVAGSVDQGVVVHCLILKKNIVLALAREFMNNNRNKNEFHEFYKITVLGAFSK